jgi:hypothetical protein
VLPTYGSFLLILVASAVVGQAAFALCGRREWSWLAPAVGLAVLMPVAWWTVRLPGEGIPDIAAIGVLSLAAAVYLQGRVADAEDALAIGLPVAALALLAASLPFLVEGRFGILGTGLNPDMSQHLFAADRIADGGTERLISEGYPLGPHAVAVAVSAVGPSLVHAFDGLTLAVAVAAALAPLALFERLTPSRRIVGALAVAFAYMVASYLIQGAFKETIEALLLLAFAIGLHEMTRWRLVGRSVPHLQLVRAIPLGLLAIGAVYAYSFPGVLWLGGAAGAWILAELASAWLRRGSEAATQLVRWAAPTAASALAVFIAGVLPELSRMIDFAGFETFDPAGAGLGNLFNPISPLEAFGIWPSGDFRLDPGDGAAPAWAYWVGAGLAVVVTGYGLYWWLGRRELAVPAALAAAAVLFAYAHFAGTPYQEAKAIALAAPLAALIAVRAVLERTPSLTALRAAPEPRTLLLAGMGTAFLVAAGACSLVALANGPVGPGSYSPGLAEVRPLEGSTLVLAPEEMLADEHGRDYLVWELRGGRVCVEEAGPPSTAPPRDGIAHVVTVEWQSDDPPYDGLSLRRRDDEYAVWRVRDAPSGPGPCPFISDGARADPGPSARDSTG